MRSRGIAIILLISLMILIFILSNQSGDVSGNISDVVALGVNIEFHDESSYQRVSTQPLAFGLSFRKYAHINYIS